MKNIIAIILSALILTGCTASLSLRTDRKNGDNQTQTTSAGIAIDLQIDGETLGTILSP
ncbi:hypothetical protein ES703_118930 [subsurface metagenome]